MQNDERSGGGTDYGVRRNRELRLVTGVILGVFLALIAGGKGDWHDLDSWAVSLLAFGCVMLLAVLWAWSPVVKFSSPIASDKEAARGASSSEGWECIGRIGVDSASVWLGVKR